MSPEVRRNTLAWVLLAVLGGGGALFWARRAPSDPVPAGAASLAAPTRPSPAELQAAGRTDLDQLAPDATELAKIAAEERRQLDITVARFGWGDCAECLGKPPGDEGEGETPLRLALGPDGEALLLDPENGRLVRVGKDGKPAGSSKLPFVPRDVAVAKDGSRLLLDARDEEGNVTLLDAQGNVRGKLPMSAETTELARRVVTSGDQVYVESSRGEYTLIGSVGGVPAQSQDVVAGIPSRDGTAWLSVRLVETEPQGVHVLVVERPSEAQRFSRLLQPTLDAEAIFLVDSSADGTIYIGLNGPRPGMDDNHAQLLCLDGHTGSVLGVDSVPIALGAESVLDGKALDGGGVMFTVSTETGVRLERMDCRP